MSEERKSRYELFLEEEARKAQLTKECSKCHKAKALGEFGICRRVADGRTSECKDCHNKRRPKKYRSKEDRFWKLYWDNTTKINDCREWNTQKGEGGARIHWKGRLMFVRRVVYQLSIGELSDDMFVIMTCRNRDCVRHSHMRLADKEDVEVLTLNSLATGERHNTPLRFAALPRGESHHRAKLTEDDVRTIRELRKSGLTHRAIADRFEMDKSTIGDLLNGKTWAHIP